MQFREAICEQEKIKGLNYEIHEDNYSIKWKWQESFDFVCIFKFRGIEDISKEDIMKQKPRIFTKDEYAEFNGYKERIIESTQYTYFIYPALKEYGELTLIEQEENDCKVLVCTGKPYIYYQIQMKNKLFSKTKEIKMIIKPETDIDKNVLCYVKKQGGYPNNKEDGILYTFLQDFNTGINTMPVIEINKDEYINIFFTDGKKYGKLYNLITM